jgi:OOP family OmpA-OmpF porin
MALQKPAKIGLVVLGVAGIVVGLQVGMNKGWIPQPGFMASLVPVKAVLPDLKDARIEHVKPAPLPLKGDADVSSTLIRASIWEWNSQMGMILATGGKRTAKGSLMARRNVNLQLTRQDDTAEMGKELVKCAKELKDGATQCSSGANFVVIMGDGVGTFASGVNPLLEEIGPEYMLQAIGSTGYSRGEDAFMAEPAVKKNPQNAKGIVVAGVLRDGDWNIVLKWAGDNGIKNNPDVTTWDPEAINWLASSDYNQAAQDYVAGKCEDRFIVKDGRKTTEKKNVCVNAVTTWTPGDVTVAQQKGGLVRIVSSKEYRSQMPSIILGPGKFFNDNREEVENMLAAIWEGGDQVKAFDQALDRAADLSAEVYDDQTGDYWEKYFKGVVERDRQGLAVELGGSAVNNLADNLILFGLAPGANDNYKSTYNVFKAIAEQQYPEEFASNPIPEVTKIVNKSFITGAQARMEDVGAEADVPVYNVAKGSVISDRDYQITFATGRSELTEEGKRQLRELKDGIAITGLSVKLTGHTDNVGDENVNRPLSYARAEAVKRYLQEIAPSNFPNSRFDVAGLGSTSPAQSNDTERGRAANRRVQVQLVGGELAETAR